MAETTQVAEGRDRKSRRFFTAEGKEPTSRATPESTGFVIQVLDGEKVLKSFTHELSDFPEGVRNAAALFGFITSITNTFGSAKISPDEACELVEARLETLLEGEWSSERTTGPRSSDILEAYVAYRAANGRETTEAKRQQFLADIKSKTIVVKDLLEEEPALKAELDAIKAKRAAERAQASKEAAMGKAPKESSLLDD